MVQSLQATIYFSIPLVILELWQIGLVHLLRVQMMTSSIVQECRGRQPHMLVQVEPVVLREQSGVDGALMPVEHLGESPWIMFCTRLNLRKLNSTTDQATHNLRRILMLKFI